MTPLVTLAAIVLSALLHAPMSARPEGVPADRLAKLARGVNLPHWFVYAPDISAKHARSYFTDVDAALIHGAGLTHVRLPVTPEYIWDKAAGEIRQQNWQELERALALLQHAGLAVVFDVHPADAHWAKPDLATGRSDGLEALWVALVTRLAATDPDVVFLEIRNEPTGIEDPELWTKAQARIIEIIRAVAPKHTIIATCDEWSNIDGLSRLKPCADRNVIYTFHFYTPHNFTHQGATWGFKPWAGLRDLPYPSSPESVGAVMEKITGDESRRVAEHYGRERWNAAKLQAEIAKAAAWGKEHGVPLYCGEFGVYRKAAPVPSRLAWLRDVRAALEKHGLGWAMWDYSGGFALTTGEPGSRLIDADTAEAIGLLMLPGRGAGGAGGGGAGPGR